MDSLTQIVLGGAVAAAVPCRRSGAAGTGRGRHRRGHRRLCCQRGARRAPRFRADRTARRTRLPAAPVPVAAEQPPHRWLRRLAAEPPAAAGGSIRRGACGGLRQGRRRRAHLRQRLGRRRLGPGAERGAGAGDGRAWLQLPARLQRRPRRTPEDHRRPGLPGAVRSGDQGQGAHAGHRGRHDHRTGAGRIDPASSPRRCGGAGTRHSLRPALAVACRRRAARKRGTGDAVPALRAA
ncbi:hypothetical protein G6F65_013303 [Rhizopus arrhizus]|nr:hypothetical protein G6F65_013303 [Rhizopus arrhizus]